jgi:hypothetical protein
MDEKARGDLQVDLVAIALAALDGDGCSEDRADEVACLVAGVLPDEEARKVFEHARRCHYCRLLLTYLAVEVDQFALLGELDLPQRGEECAAAQPWSEAVPESASGPRPTEAEARRSGSTRAGDRPQPVAGKTARVSGRLLEALRDLRLVGGTTAPAWCLQRAAVGCDSHCMATHDGTWLVGLFRSDILRQHAVVYACNLGAGAPGASVTVMGMGAQRPAEPLFREAFSLAPGEWQARRVDDLCRRALDEDLDVEVRVLDGHGEPLQICQQQVPDSLVAVLQANPDTPGAATIVVQAANDLEGCAPWLGVLVLERVVGEDWRGVLSDHFSPARDDLRADAELRTQMVRHLESGAHLLEEMYGREDLAQTVRSLAAKADDDA